jgi:phosphoribosylamine--glycine ligase
MRLRSDLFDLMWAATESPQALAAHEPQWDRRTALGVVAAAHGYPLTPRKGDVISALPVQQDDCMVFHAGTVLQDGQLQVNGGRVLCVTALGDNLRNAQALAYQTLQHIQFDGMQYRRDIGHRAMR